MRVLYLSYDGLTDPLGQSQILPYLMGLAKRGHQIDIISFEKKQAFEALGTSVTSTCKNAGLGYYPSQYRKHPPVVSTLLDIREMRRKAIALHRKNNYQIVHCRSYIASLVGHHLQQKYGLKFIFDMRGFYADERVDGNIWPQSNWVYRSVYKYFKRKEKTFLRSANHIISLTHNAKSIIESWNLLPDGHNNISVIPCCVDTQLFDPKQVKPEILSSLRKELSLENRSPVVGYIGSTGTWYLLDDMFRYFREVLNSSPTAVFLFLSHDPGNDIYTAAKRCNVPADNIRIKAVNRPQMPVHMALFDWSVFFIKPVFSKAASSPTKQGELMSMGIPVVCNAGVGDSEQIVVRYDAGICLPDTKNETLSAAAKKSKKLTAPNRETIILGAKEYFSLENGVSALHQIYDSPVE